jgi:hypothetical protein
MKRFFHIILILCSFNICILGNNKNVKEPNDAFSPISPWTFGAEWSYVGTFHYSTRFNYFNTEGYRQNRNSHHFGYWSNGEALLHVGYNLTDRWNLSVYAGISGMADIHNAVPVSIRATHYFSKDSATKDTWLAFADLGTGLSIKHEPQEILTGKIGGGYRFSLSPDTKLDFIAAFRLAYTHPQIMDGDDMITLKWTNRNIAFLQSFSIGMAIIF